ncbi:MAG: site-2 protease family protein [Duodenibacillus sp.]|nr:site-2 protease family protein [Duodenibacillus sp.]
MQNIILTIAIYAIPAILAITLHEAAHGYAAKQLGDPTAYMLGRVTLNPIRHIDPVGTVLIPGLLLLGSLISGASGILFGWAKPVPVNFGRLRNPKTDMVLVALAGPASNLLQAIVWVLLIRFLVVPMPEGLAQQVFFETASAGVSVNLMLMAFNLIPILPLDGGRILEGLLPYRLAASYAQLERYGMIIMIILIASGLLNVFITPFLRLGSWILEMFL